MVIEGPPLHQQTAVIPSFTNDPVHNRREFDAAMDKAIALGCIVKMPVGDWPLSVPLNGDRQ